MGQDSDARRVDRAARWGAESGAASAPVPAAPDHNRVSLSPGPGLPAAGGLGSDNDCASAGMADGSVDHNMVPPLPPTASDASSDAPLIISSDGITLSAELAGMDESHFRSFFDNGVQCRCASGDGCGSEYAVSGSTHRCGCCGLKIHSILVCNGHLFGSWLARADGFIPAMLPPYGKAKYDQYLGDFSSSDVAICHSCQVKMDKEFNLPKPRAEDDEEGGTQTTTATTTSSGKQSAAIDWQHVIPTLSWKSLKLSAGDSNQVQKGNRQTAKELTRLKGIEVADGRVEATKNINLDTLRKIGGKIGLGQTRGKPKKQVCDLLVAFYGNKEIEERTGVASLPSGQSITWNVPRYLNVMFSDDFAHRFATRGKALDKDQLDSGIMVDQALFTDFIAAYNDNSIRAYGNLAHQSLGLPPSLHDPALFRPVEGDSATTWKSARDRFKLLGGEYEKSLRMWTQSGTHCDYEDLDNINPDPATCTSPCMIYMHYFMRAHPQLLEVCTSLLPADVASQSNISGCNIRRGAAPRNKSNGGRSGPGNGSKKNKVGSDIAIAALDSIASKNSAKVQNILMETERVLRSDINDENTKKRRLLSQIVTHCGCKKVATERMNKVKAKMLNETETTTEEASVFDTSDDEPDSQESIIGEYFETVETLIKLKERRVIANRNLQISFGKEN